MNLSPEIAQNLEEQVEQLSIAAKFEQAVDVGLELLAIYEKQEDHRAYLKTLNDIVRHNIYLSRQQVATNFSKQAMKIASQHFDPTDEIMLQTHDHRAYAYLANGQYQKSQAIYRETLKIRIQKYGVDSREVGLSHMQLGRHYTYTGESFLQHHHCTEALRILEANPEGVESVIGSTYNNMGIHYYDRGNYDESVKCYNSSKEWRSKSVEDGDYWDSFYYNNLGLCFQQMGDTEEALTYFRQSLMLRKKLFGDNHKDVAQSYNNIGVFFDTLLRWEEALENFSKALRISQIAFGEHHSSTSKYYFNVAHCHYSLKQYELARENYQRAIEIRENLEPVNLIDLSYALSGMAHLHRDFDQFAEAETLLQRALAVLAKEDISSKAMTYAIHWQRSVTFRQKGDYVKSLQTMQTALNHLIPNYHSQDFFDTPKGHADGYLIQQIEMMDDKANALMKNFDETGDPRNLRTAYNSYLLAAELIDRVRSVQKSVGSRYELSRTAAPIYEQCLEVNYMLDQIEPSEDLRRTAFKLAERGKSMNLLLMINETKAKITANIPEALLNRESELSFEMSYHKNSIIQEKAKGEDANPALIEEMEQKYFANKLEYNKLIKDFERDFPQYYDLKYTLEELDTAELQSMMDSKSCIIEYFVGHRNIFIFILSNRFLKYVKVDLPDNLSQLQQRLRECIDLLEFKDFSDTAHQLYNYLLKPVLEHINGCKKLIFICDDVINFVPFDALVSKLDPRAKHFSELEYFIREYTVSYHYSAHLYLNTLRKEAKSSRDEKSFLGIAPVNFGAQEAKELVMESGTLTGYETKVLQVDEVAEDTQLSNLPNTVAEVKAVYDQFTKKQLDAMAFLYGSASKTNLFKYGKRYKYILIATHGFGDERDLKLSGIYLAKGRTKEHDDNKLYISDAYRLSLDANLVVLSSCSSGIGELLIGEGLIAINRGFLYSGAANIIFSLFDIPDSSTSELVQELFNNIIEGVDYASSLRKAKLKILQRPEMSVQDWAGFALIGS